MTVQARLAQLEGGLAKLASKSQSVHDILSLRAQYPEIFLPLSKTNEDRSFMEPEKLAVITSCTTLYSTAASQLMSIKDLPVPVAEMSAYLISLHPRLARIQVLQNSQAKEIADLRLRTASVLQRWYEIAVLSGGECWIEWEDRIAGVEKVVRIEEAARSRDDSHINGGEASVPG